MWGRLRAAVRVVRAGNVRARVRVLRDGPAAVRVAALGAGVRSGVLEALRRRPLRVEALADEVGATDAALLAAFLRTLEAGGLVRAAGGRWGMTPRARDILDDDVARAAAVAYGGYHTDLYRGLPAQLAGGPPRTDVADEGETIAQLSGGFQPFVEEIVRSTVRAEAPRRVVDVGCGAGRLLVAMLEEAPGAVGLGVDDDADAVGLAERSLVAAGLGDRAHVSHEDATTLAAMLGTRGGPADLVLLANVVYYLPEEERVAFGRTLHGMLRPGGTLLLVTTAAEPDAFSRHFDLLLRAQGLGMGLPDVGVLGGQLADAGFRDIVARRPVPGVPLVAFRAVAA